MSRANFVYNKIFKMFSDDSRPDQYEANSYAYSVNYAMLSSYIMNSYRFKGLPEEIDQNLMWAILTERSTGVLFRDAKTDKFMFTPYNTNGTQKNMNRTYYPVSVTATDFLNIRHKVDTMSRYDGTKTTGVLVYISNTSRFKMDMHLMIHHYALKLADIDRAMDVRRKYHKLPVIFAGGEKYQSTFKQLIEALDSNKSEFIVTSEMIDQLQMQPLDFKYINTELYSEKKRYINEFLHMWGIDNNNQEDKTERVNTDEVASNNEQLLINRDNVLLSLQDACDRFNVMFEDDPNISRISADYMHNHIEEPELNLFEDGGEDYDI